MKSAIPHPRILGIVRECGGKMHMSDGLWSEAATDFFEARARGAVPCAPFVFRHLAWSWRGCDDALFWLVPAPRPMPTPAR